MRDNPGNTPPLPGLFPGSQPPDAACELTTIRGRKIAFEGAMSASGEL
jgi:hypothetical protein